MSKRFMSGTMVFVATLIAVVMFAGYATYADSSGSVISGRLAGISTPGPGPSPQWSRDTAGGPCNYRTRDMAEHGKSFFRIEGGRSGKNPLREKLRYKENC